MAVLNDNGEYDLEAGLTFSLRWTPLLHSLRPIAGFAMQVGNRYNYDHLVIQTVDQSKRKSSKQTSPQARFDLRTRQGIGNGTSNNPVKFIKKFEAEPRCLVVIPCDRVIDFRLGRREKADLHGRRCFSMTA